MPDLPALRAPGWLLRHSSQPRSKVGQVGQVGHPYEITRDLGVQPTPGRTIQGRTVAEVGQRRAIAGLFAPCWGVVGPLTGRQGSASPGTTIAMVVRCRVLATLGSQVTTPASVYQVARYPDSQSGAHPRPVSVRC